MEITPNIAILKSGKRDASGNTKATVRLFRDEKNVTLYYPIWRYVKEKTAMVTNECDIENKLRNMFLDIKILKIK